jgi:hypothetical protein
MKPATRWALLWIGHVNVVLGLIGIFLPLMPTTPFLLLATACYVRSSERHYRWILASPLFGPIIRDYQQKRGITLKNKIVALSLLWASLLFSIWRTDRQWVEWFIVCVGIAASGMILRIRTIRSEKSASAAETPASVPIAAGETSGSE